MEMLSTKISGLAVDTEYSFHLVLRTSGGTYSSNVLAVRTHKMTDLSGITVTPGVLPQQLRDSLEAAVQRIGGRIVDTVRIDTPHFVCTEGRGRDWERAVETNIPIVRPEWVEGCEREGKIVGVRAYYLDADPKHRQVGSNPTLNAPSGSRPPSSTVPPTGAGVQTAAPSRALPKEPEKGRHTSGEGNGPGPEVPPTPPPKTESPVSPVSEPEKEESTNEGAEEGTDEENEEEEELPSRARQKASVEDEKEEDEEVDDEEEEEERPGGDMDEVPL